MMLIIPKFILRGRQIAFCTILPSTFLTSLSSASLHLDKTPSVSDLDGAYQQVQPNKEHRQIEMPNRTIPDSISLCSIGAGSPCLAKCSFRAKVTSVPLPVRRIPSFPTSTW